MTPQYTAFSLADALRTARDTRALEIGPGVLELTPNVFRKLFGARPALIVADTNTFAAAGEAVVGAFATRKSEVPRCFVFDEPQLHAEHRHVVKLEELLRHTDAVPVAVGSGTINDLAKLAAHRTGRPYMCVATAASMDGYTAFGASITSEGLKQTFTCPAPAAVIADLDVICAAPPHMRAWGYADLVAKFTAGADWILADALGVEPIEPRAWAIAQGRLRELTADAPGIARADPEAVRKLLEGLLLSGFAMQAAQSSRPASGAEHHFSHLWDMQGHTHRGVPPSHGFKVGIGTLAVTALYEELLKLPLHQLDVEQCCAAWPDAETWAARAREWFTDTRLAEHASRELRAKHVHREALAAQLVKLRAIWPALSDALRAQLLPFETLRLMLEDAGAPSAPEQIGITRVRLRLSYWQALCIRRRFTVLDIAARANVLEYCLDRIFGPDGPWPSVRNNS
ncbi:MAG: sn-glycerol-1-phosphate dehydrogenase [Verrucomicrobiales bacterium]|nr:sn-glycerol-1-phosphate dehydrogenase [Verrucomicrobiales bacterium]